MFVVCGADASLPAKSILASRSRSTTARLREGGHLVFLDEMLALGDWFRSHDRLANERSSIVAARRAVR